MKKNSYKNPFYCFVEFEDGLCFIPIYQAIVVVLSGYGKYVPRRNVKLV